MKEKFIPDNRGVSEVIGAILVFGLLIALLAILQTQAIPAANEEVEFNHNQDVQSDLVQFKEAASRTTAQGTRESTRIRMGVAYPTRLLFFNPPQPSGTIRTSGGGTATIENINSTNPDVNQYLSSPGVDHSIESPETQRLEYEPGYNEFRDAPTTVLEYGGLYRVFDDETAIVEDNPDVISGNTIDLTYFSGELERSSSRSLSLESRPTSAPARTVTVEPERNEAITLNLPTRLLSEEAWENVFDGEPNVESWNLVEEDERIEIELVDGRYQLRMAEIGTGGAAETPDAEYITRASGTGGTLDPESARQLPIEVRDKYNNPVSGQQVNVSVSSGTVDGSPQTTATTDDQGQPQLVFEPDEPGRIIVNASFQTDNFDSAEFDPQNNREDTQFSIAVQDLLDQEAPVVEPLDTSDWDGECGTDFELELITIGTVDSCAIEMGFSVTDGAGNLDTVEIRMIDAEDRTIVDSMTLDVSSDEGDGKTRDANDDPVGLVDEGTSEGTYDIRVIATDETGLSDEQIERDVNPDNL